MNPTLDPLALIRGDLCSRKGSAWATPVCAECRGVGTDLDGDECPECEGAGRTFFRATSRDDRAIVALDFVDAWGPLVAMSALGFHVGDSLKRDEIAAARAEWATVYRDAFGSDERTLVGAETTLGQAMRDAVAVAAVMCGAGVQRESSKTEEAA